MNKTSESASEVQSLSWCKKKVNTGTSDMRVDLQTTVGVEDCGFGFVWV
jgi:hypothetical protein